MYGQTTKICKFYRPGRPDSCRNGDTCWFIHDDEVRPRSRRSSRTNSQDDSTGIKISLGGQGGRRVVIDPKYKYIADKASSTSSSVVVVQKPAQSIDAASKSSNLQHKDLKKKEEPLFDPNIYSAMDKLTVEDLNQFKADDFTLGQIPLMPPPLELS